MSNDIGDICVITCGGCCNVTHGALFDWRFIEERGKCIPSQNINHDAKSEKKKKKRKETHAKLPKLDRFSKAMSKDNNINVNE